MQFPGARKALEERRVLSLGRGCDFVRCAACARTSGSSQLVGKAGLSGIRSWCVTRNEAVLGFSPAGRRHRTRATTRARRDGAATTGGEGRCHERNKRSTAEPMGVKVGWHSRAPARWRPCAVRISFPQAERMAAMRRIRFSSGSPWLINACATRSATFRPEASTTRATSTTPAVSASSSTPRGIARTRSSARPSRC